LLYSALLEKLSETIYLGKSHREFLSQLFGIESVDEILIFLSDDSQDIMTFYDWLFFPDVSFQMKIESILLGRKISTREEANLIDRLIQKNIQSMIQLDEKTKQMIRIGPVIISAFVNRLGLKRHIPKKIIDIPYIDQHQKISVLIHLRNENIEWTENRCNFVHQVIHTFLDDLEELLIMLPWVVRFCGQYQQDFMQELARRKSHISQSLERFQNLKALQEKHSMEFLLSSGIRSIYVDEKQSKAEIAMIDKILFFTNQGTDKKKQALFSCTFSV